MVVVRRRRYTVASVRAACSGAALFRGCPGQRVNLAIPVAARWAAPYEGHGSVAALCVLTLGLWRPVPSPRRMRPRWNKQAAGAQQFRLVARLVRSGRTGAGPGSMRPVELASGRHAIKQYENPTLCPVRARGARRTRLAVCTLEAGFGLASLPATIAAVAKIRPLSVRQSTTASRQLSRSKGLAEKCKNDELSHPRRRGRGTDGGTTERRPLLGRARDRLARRARINQGHHATAPPWCVVCYLV